VLLAVEKEGAYANLALQKSRSHLVPEPREAALLTELVNGVLRWRNTLDWAIGRFSKVPVARMNYIVRNIVRLGVYQLLFLERVPAAAACNESVELAKRWGLDGLAGFVNGLLRAIARQRSEIDYPPLDGEPALHISVRYSHPAWLVSRWLGRFDTEETIALCRANNEPPPVVLRCNTLKIGPPELRLRLEREGVNASPSPLLPGALRVTQSVSIAELPSFREGCFAVQDESSILASLVLRPQPGSLVVDACAGPGGKTTHLAQLMGNSGRLLAFDVHPHRLRLVQEACLRLGAGMVETRLHDATTPAEDMAEMADYLLVDAPCSGLGVIRRRPDLRWRAQEDDLAGHGRQQRQILDAMSRCLKPGGTMLYSTCSTEPEENGEVVETFLQEHEDWRALDISDRVPPALLNSDDDRRMAGRGCLQLLPHRHGTDGFFLAALNRKRGAPQEVKR
jgi:16S rRNA (cytosine967-C5)-methyltransferase